MPRNRNHKNSIDVSALLRSIHVRMDATEPDRIAHFRPTSKSIPLLEALLGRESSKAWLVTAPYGTGKSLSAAYLLHLVENHEDAHDTLQVIEGRLREANPTLADFAARRRRKGVHGLVLVLEGYESDLPQALQRALLEAMDRLRLGRQARPIRSHPTERIDDTLAMLDLAFEKAREAGIDRFAIIWDEFGRHLEALVAEGRAGALADVQTLAEYVARSAPLPGTLGLLLHQTPLQYASHASRSVRTEWAKIEGRFTTHQYLDDSKELYRLLADAVSARRPDVLHTNKATFRAAAKQTRALGHFSEWTLDELTDLLHRAYPLEPLTLALLPRLSARVAQNERTLFAFLYETALDAPIGPDRLYDYFSPAMRADTAVGGTHRRWLETESALSKMDGVPLATQALKAAALLGLGLSGERARASYEAVVFAAAGYGQDTEARNTVDDLIARNLLLHRRHSDQVAVWHGTDLDLRGRLEDVTARERESFRLVDFLAEEAPPPVWKPVAHNNAFDVRRFLSGAYCTLTELGSYLGFAQHVDPLPAQGDGRILYLLADDNEALSQALDRVQNELKHERVIIAVPQESVPLTDAALEVWCLRKLQHDPELMREDPLAGAELEQLADDARAHLQRLVDRIVQPGPAGPRWFYQGQEFEARSPRALRQRLSAIMTALYPSTPRIRNEMINRHRPSRVLVNARKKVVLGILERAGSRDLGITGQTPDASIYRTVLARTGLYRQTEDGAWGFARPDEIADPGLRAIWQYFEAFFTEYADDAKAPETVFNALMQPPYGVRRGLLPILFAAAYQAFPSAIAITRDGAYVEDVLASDIEDMLRQPARYVVRVLALTGERRAYLEGLYRVFAGEDAAPPGEGDLVRACYDALTAWQEELPPAALTSCQVDMTTQGLQQVLASESEPVQLLLERMPRACGAGDPTGAAVERIRHAKAALEGVADHYTEQAAAAVHRVLALHRSNGHSARETALEWANCFPDALVQRFPERRLTGLVSRLRTPYTSDAQLVDSLAQLLIGRPVKRWDDASLITFERELDAAARRIEEVALSAAVSLDELGPDAGGLAALARERMCQWYARYLELAGDKAAAQALQELEKPSTNDRDAGKEGEHHGHHAGRAQ